MKTLSLLSIVCILGAGSLAADSTFTYSLSGNSATITGFASTAATSGALTIPSTVDGYTVVAVGRSAFKNQAGITSLSFASGSSVPPSGRSLSGLRLLERQSASPASRKSRRAVLDCSKRLRRHLPDVVPQSWRGFAGAKVSPDHSARHG
jgi:hypothetical protein